MPQISPVKETVEEPDHGLEPCDAVSIPNASTIAQPVRRGREKRTVPSAEKSAYTLLRKENIIEREALRIPELNRISH